MSDQPFDPDRAAGRKPVRKWTARLWLVLLGVATVAWMAGLAWAAIWLIGIVLF
jgi:hypothetical protein